MKDNYSPYDFSDALIAGHEIVIVSSDEKFDSAIFFLENNYLYTYSRHMGEFKRSLAEYPLSSFNEHIKNMLAEDAKVFIRGLA